MSTVQGTDFYHSHAEIDLGDPVALMAELQRLRPLAELGNMAATVAHEVRNPLAGISANAELLRECLHQADDIESVDVILAEVARLSNLVNDLLHYARERAPELGPLDLGQLVRQVAELSRRQAEQVGVDIVVSGAGLVQGDRDLSRQALLNILRNAIQASPEGGVVELRVEETSVLVSDCGPGVPEALVDRIFDPFVSGRTRGMGLGAAVARRCLRRQGGGICLMPTEAGRGACFRLHWPVA